MKELKYRRTYYLGGHEFESFELADDVNENEDPSEVLSELRKFCEFHRTKITSPILPDDDPVSSEESLGDKLRRATQERRARNGATVKDKAEARPKGD